MPRPTPEPDPQFEWQRRLHEAMQARAPAWSNKELSLAAGLNETFVRDALQRHRAPSIENLARLAKALGVRAAWLAAYDDGDPSEV